MPNGPIKLVGDSAVNVALHTDVVVEINVTAVSYTHLTLPTSDLV